MRVRFGTTIQSASEFHFRRFSWLIQFPDKPILSDDTYLVHVLQVVTKIWLFEYEIHLRKVSRIPNFGPITHMNRKEILNRTSLTH